jgi:hypothetical protein
MEPPRRADEDCPVIPKFTPDKVTLAPPDPGVLVVPSTDTTGALYVNTDMRVPTTALTVSVASRPFPLPTELAATNDVYVVHLTVVQTVLPRVTLGVTSSPPKLKPRSVISAAPLLTRLIGVRLDITGASNEKNEVAAQPTRALIVTPIRTPEPTSGGE